MFDYVLIPPSVMASIVASYHANINHWRQLADDNQDMAAVLPGKPSLNGKPRMFTALQAALFALMADFIVAGEFTIQTDERRTFDGVDGYRG